MPWVRPTPSVITAVRDLARLETAEVHVEKVVDLTDRQSRFFGLIELGGSNFDDYTSPWRHCN